MSLGAQASVGVRYHNKIADWVAKAIKMAHKMHVYVVIEQPLTSLLFRYKPVFLALSEVGSHKISRSGGIWSFIGDA